MDQARKSPLSIGFPIIIREPAFTLGGTGGGIAYNPEDLEPFWPIPAWMPA
jgi:carbamoyl-phosphate synthase large subunit